MKTSTSTKEWTDLTREEKPSGTQTAILPPSHIDVVKPKAIKQTNVLYMMWSIFKQSPVSVPRWTVGASCVQEFIEKVNTARSLYLWWKSVSKSTSGFNRHVCILHPNNVKKLPAALTVERSGQLIRADFVAVHVAAEFHVHKSIPDGNKKQQFR